MVALKRQIIDVVAADGVAQKTSIYRLPANKSIAAVNLEKNKQGQLDKRLGYSQLGTGRLNGVFLPNKGKALATCDQNLLAIQQGTWSTGGLNGTQTLTALSAYMPDSGQWRYVGPLPEVAIPSDVVTSSSSTSVSHPTEVLLAGDLRLQVWIDLAAGGMGGNTSIGIVKYQVLEVSTGNVVIPSTPIDAVNNAGHVELMLSGGTAIVVYSNTISGNTIFAAKANVTNILSSPVITWSAPATLTAANASPFNNFSSASVAGDTGNFLLMYSTVAGTFTVKLSKVSINTLAITATTNLVTDANTPGSYGIRCDTTTGVAAVAFAQVSAGSIFAPTAQYTLKLATVTYSTMVQIGANLLAYTGGSTGGGVDNNEYLPGWIAIGYEPISKLWTAAWSPFNSNYCSRAPGANPTLMAYNNTRITAVQFANAGGPSLDAGSAGGTLTRITYGVHLASRFLETNGILYCLGYIPSPTQGGYVLLAADWACVQGDNASGVAWPMRPCGQIQTRTCLHNLQNSDTRVTCQMNGSNFTQLSDAYLTAGVAYLSTSIGNKYMLAAARIQFAPTQGYPYAEWGNTTAFGGGLPSVDDGTNVYEQNFLYAPDGNNNGAGGQQTKAGFFATWAGSGNTFTWNAVTDAWSWIVTYEQFDDKGNYHQSARSVQVTITGQNLIDWGLTSNATTLANGGAGISNDVALTIPTLGVTNRMSSADTSGPTGAAAYIPPDAPVNIGVYRTGKSTGPFKGIFFRVQDPVFDSTLGVVSNGNGSGRFVANPATNGGSYQTFTDSVPDSTLTNTQTFLIHPLLYGDGTTGAPGNIDEFCPPATPIMVRHKERLWTARGNQLFYTKQRAELVGMGYDDVIKTIVVGNDDPITACESMDDKLVVMKAKQLYYVGGDGPADNGAGNSFSPPQPIPSDSGCVGPGGVKSTPDGVYFMSGAGLRVLTRALTVEYAGGPAETEFATYPTLLSTVLYPTNNKILFYICQDDTQVETVGEWVNRDYVLDAWTTGLFKNTNVGAPISSAVAQTSRLAAGGARSFFTPVLYIMTRDGKVWQERDPLSATPYFDGNTYIQAVWVLPIIRASGDMGRFRLWDIITMILSNDPHGLQIVVEDNYGADPITYNWTYAQISGAGLPLSHVRNYYGKLGEGFIISFTDVADGSSVSGKGATFLGATLGIGVAGDNFKIASGQTQ